MGAVFRDRWVITSLGYYIPSLLVVVSGVAWLLVVRGTRWRFWRGLVAVLTLVALIKFSIVDYSWRGTYGPRDNAIRVVNWNVGRGQASPEELLAELRKDDGDIFLLSECPDTPAYRALGKKLVGYGFFHYQDEMLLASRYPFLVLDAPGLTGTTAWVVRFGLPRHGNLDLLAVDVINNRTHGRASAMKTLEAWLSTRDARRWPLIVMGDFNMKRDSYYFEPIRKHLRHAYEQRGNRQWPYTWPTVLPLYAIDHAWYSRVRVYHYELKRSPLSDHTRQVMDVLPMMPR